MSDDVFKPIRINLSQIEVDIRQKKYKGLLHKHSQNNLMQRLDRERRNINNELGYISLKKEYLNKEAIEDVTINHKKLINVTDKIENKIRNRQPTDLEQLAGIVIKIAGFLGEG